MEGFIDKLRGLWEGLRNALSPEGGIRLPYRSRPTFPDYSYIREEIDDPVYDAGDFIDHDGDGDGS